jgi:hypothetical protein
MKRAAIYLFALALAVTTVSLQSASANGFVRGNTFAIALEGLPDVCPANAVMAGTISIAVYPNGTRLRQAFTYEVFAETPFGSGLVDSGRFRMLPGHDYTHKLVIPVDAKAPRGEYKLTIVVTSKTETLSVDHVVMVVPEM